MADKLKFKTIGFSERQIEMINEIREKTGVTSDVDVVRNSVSDMHRKLFPDYVSKTRVRDLSPEDAAERAQSITEAKETAKRNSFIKICDALGGKVVGNTCVYSTFSKQGVFEQTLPLEHLDHTIIEQQFFPDRASVEALVSSGKLKAKLPPRK